MAGKKVIGDPKKTSPSGLGPGRSSGKGWKDRVARRGTKWVETTDGNQISAGYLNKMSPAQKKKMLAGEVAAVKKMDEKHRTRGNAKAAAKTARTEESTRGTANRKAAM